ARNARSRPQGRAPACPLATASAAASPPARLPSAGYAAPADKPRPTAGRLPDSSSFLARRAAAAAAIARSAINSPLSAAWLVPTLPLDWNSPTACIAVTPSIVSFARRQQQQVRPQQERAVVAVVMQTGTPRQMQPHISDAPSLFASRVFAQMVYPTRVNHKDFRMPARDFPAVPGNPGEDEQDERRPRRKIKGAHVRRDKNAQRQHKHGQRN